MPVNSLISAPATKPLFLAEITTTPRGRSFSSVASRPSSSLSTPPESTLAELPGLSIVSQAILSESRSSFQDPLTVSFMRHSSLIRWCQAAETARAGALARIWKSHTSGR